MLKSVTARKTGSTFSPLKNKDQVWKDLLALTNDEHSDARVSANHSLGKTYRAANSGVIFTASAGILDSLFITGCSSLQPLKLISD